MNAPGGADAAGARRLAAAEADSTAARARDHAAALPVLGAILLLPPVAQIFAMDGRIFGVPVVIAYVFGVWALLILTARRIGRDMLAGEEARAREAVERHAGHRIRVSAQERPAEQPERGAPLR
ncbi:MAG: hypothetical protein AAF074_23400 [Pseudomonadota bacterium]